MRSREGASDEDYRYERKEAKAVRGNESEQEQQRRMELYVFLGC